MSRLIGVMARLRVAAIIARRNTRSRDYPHHQSSTALAKFNTLLRAKAERAISTNDCPPNLSCMVRDPKFDVRALKATFRQIIVAELLSIRQCMTQFYRNKEGIK
jgi:hypothetical protein